MSDAIDYAEIIRDYEETPFHIWMGLKVTRADAGGVEVTIPWRDEFYAQKRRVYMHGGVLASVVDLVADLAIAAKIGRALPTIDLRTDYHRANPGTAMRATGDVIKAGRTIVTAEAHVFDMAGNLLASGRGAYLNAR
jgi:uncharacterized protein (TIGR00369 family)